MKYNNIMPYYSYNMYPNNSVSGVKPMPYPARPGDRLIGPGGFLLPFALGFVSSPLIFGATRPRPPYAPIYGPGYFPYY